MSGDVTLTAALRSNLLSLQGTQRLLDTTQIRLSTGRKVNSALDDPNAFFASQSLNFRANDMSRLLDGIGQGIQTLKAADQGITSLTKLVEQAQSIAQTARDQASGAAVDLSDDLTVAQQNDITTIGGVDAADQFTLQAGAGNPVTTFTISANMSLTELAAQISSVSGFTAQVVAGSDPNEPTERRLEIRTTNGEDLITTDGNGALTGLGITVGTVTANTEPPADRVQLESDFNAIRTQINQLIQDTGYRGTNLLNGDSLTVQFNEDNTSTLTVAGVTFDADGLGVNSATFDTVDNIEGTLTEVQSALDTLRARARTFGGNLAIIQTREDFTRNLVNTLKEGADKLTLADTNEEGAKLLALNTAQQLGITSLSLASQAQQSVLRLF